MSGNTGMKAIIRQVIFTRKQIKTINRNNQVQKGLLGAAWMLGLAAPCAYGALDAMALASVTGPQV